MEDCWDLQAIILGHSSPSLDSSIMNTDFGDFSACNFSDRVLEFDELEQIYRPFLSVDPSSPVSITATTGTTSSSLPTNTTYLKKRKGRNPQKKVVHQVVSLAGPSSDKWAWRKYGQKPIKGSVYPRSYYKCSTSKGCMARKQVERSCTDPAKFIITYSAEHDHPYPARRSCLAGSTRSNNNKCVETVMKDKEDDTFSCSPNSSTTSDLSPAVEVASKEDADHIKNGEEDFEFNIDNWNLRFDEGFLCFDDFSETSPS